MYFVYMYLPDTVKVNRSMTTTGLLHLTIPIVTNVCSFFCFASDAKDFLAKSELLNYFEKIQTNQFCYIIYFSLQIFSNSSKN